VCFSGCGKIIVEKRYTKKITGNWRITEIKITSGNALYPAYNFKNEKFSFNKDSKQSVTDPLNKTYDGKWFVYENKYQGDCYTAPAGNTVCNDIYEVSLKADTWIPTTQEIKGINFEDVEFMNDDLFRASIIPNPVTSYDYYFKRE
jgi:hypothetical protein